MPAESAIAIVATVSWIVAGMRSTIRVLVGDWLTIDVPRSPVTTRPSQSTYWTGRGRSRPSSDRTRAICSGLASIPVTVTTGSPGTRWMIKKMPTEASSTTGMSCRRRTAM